MLLRRLVFALLLADLIGCAATDPQPDAGPVDPAVELGSGEGTFHTLEDGETLELMPGCQGSQHVWVALRTWGLDPRGPIISLELVRDSDGMTVSQAFRVRVSLDTVSSTTYAEVWGLTLVVPEPAAAIGHDLTLRATVTDMNGVEVSDARSIQVEWVEDGPCGSRPAP